MDEAGVTEEAGTVLGSAVRGKPASAPSPSSADIVSVTALARVCRCVPIGE
jgi:hypothetical protein